MSPYSDWQNGIVNRNFYIFKNLEKNPNINKIISVDFLPKKLKSGIKYYYKNLLFGQKNKAVVFGDLTSIAYKASDKTYVYSSVDLIWSSKQIIKELKKLISKLNLSENLIIWSYNPLFIDFIDKINYDLFVFDTVDNWSEHSQYLKITNKRKMLANYKKIAGKANVIFTVSKDLLRFYENFGRTDSISWIPNGVDYAHYADLEKYNIETGLDEEKRKIIGYIGTIQDRLDYDLIKFIAEKNTDKVIVMAGPIWKNVQSEIKTKLGNLPNVQFLGRIHFDKAPAYINKFNVCIIPHKIDKFVKSMNPMKMYEYLACGKPVITTEGAGLAEFKEYFYIANDHQKFNDFINKALVEDSNELKLKRQNIAKKHDWSYKINKMLNEIINN